MNFQSKRRMAIILMAISLVFTVATAYTLIFYIGGRDHSEVPPAEGDHSGTTETEWSEEKRWLNPDPYGRPWSPDPISRFI